jgi:hypothetical protein
MERVLSDNLWRLSMIVSKASTIELSECWTERTTVLIAKNHLEVIVF